MVVTLQNYIIVNLIHSLRMLINILSGGRNAEL
jgi:hypothetical protein